MLARRYCQVVVVSYLTITAAFAAETTQPGDQHHVPRVLIIGDSISIGYTEPVRELLRDEAEVTRIPGNAAHTWNGLEKLDEWLKDGKYEVIHFNWGLHDLKYLRDGKLDLAGQRVSALDQYQVNLDQLVGRLKAAGAQLIWASTTPIPEGAGGRKQGEEIEFNAAAREIMDAHGVRVDDLHSYIMPYLAVYQQPRNVHFTKEGSRFLASKVARSIRGVLQDQKPPFEMPEVRPPTFPDRKVSIRDHGAVSDGRTLNTQAIAKAIAACADAGGGMVLVPTGVWLTGAIHLKSNINLHLEAGAELRFSTNPADYLPAVFLRWAGFECYNYSPLIYANGCTNIAITGAGKLEGQGKPWWDWVKQDGRTSQKLYRMVLDDVPAAKRVFANKNDPLRPQFIQPINCRNVLIEGVTITSGPFWTIQVVYCENVIVRRVTVVNEGPNNDGCNIDSSRNAIVEHCIFATADDSVALKSGLNEDGWRVGRPTENVIVRHCRMKRGHGGVVFGSDMSGGVRNVFVHDCDFSGSDIGIRLKSCPGRGGVVENVWCRDIELGTIKAQAITVHTDYSAYMGTKQGKPPTFRDIHIQDVTCQQAGQAARIVGLPEQAIENVTLDGVIITAHQGLTCENTRGLTLSSTAIVPSSGPAIQIKNSRDVTIQQSLCPPQAKPYLRIQGSESANIQLFEKDLPRDRTAIEFADGARPDAVIWK